MEKNSAEEKKVKNKKQTNKKEKEFTFSFIQLILVIVIIFSGFKIITWYVDNGKSSKIIEEIKNNIVIDEENIDKFSFKTLKEMNTDTVAWIKVNGTNIDYPVVQTINNEYYLNHSFDKTANGAGWIFADYKNLFDGSDKNIVIYGHNRRDGSMFSSLKNILNNDWYNNENNKTITFLTEKENSKYEVFSIYQIEDEEYYITTDFTNMNYNSFLQLIKSRSINKYKTDLNENDTILTLSTCANDNKYRVVLHAKKIVEETKSEGDLNEKQKGQ